MCLGIVVFNKFCHVSIKPLRYQVKSRAQKADGQKADINNPIKQKADMQKADMSKS
jgi:hypothetical protein